MLLLRTGWQATSRIATPSSQSKLVQFLKTGMLASQGVEDRENQLVQQQKLVQTLSSQHDRQQERLHAAFTAQNLTSQPPGEGGVPNGAGQQLPSTPNEQQKQPARDCQGSQAAQHAAILPEPASNAPCCIGDDNTQARHQGGASNNTNSASAISAQQRQQQKVVQPQGHKPRPTHFVSLRVSHSPQVVSCIEHVQQELLSACPDLQPCLLEPVTAHMTLLVLHIEPQVQEGIAAAVMESLPAVLQQQGLGKQQVTLRGLSTFRNQVLYLDVAPGADLDQLQQLGQAIISHFRSQGSDIFLDEGDRGFTPHVTVAKTSRLKGGHHHHRRKKGKPRTKIPPEAWSGCADVCGGDVLLAELQICSMQGRKTGEFYKVTHSVQLPVVPKPPTANEAALVQQPEAEAAAGVAQERKRASGGPVSEAKRRFSQLLHVLTCRQAGQLKGVDAAGIN